ncbi:MAG: cache domain-containing protein, partial [Spirochaetales bacterium]|nr:cache domain-containing protein [Spirochaetales bacterium]
TKIFLLIILIIFVSSTGLAVFNVINIDEMGKKQSESEYGNEYRMRKDMLKALVATAFEVINGHHKETVEGNYDKRQTDEIKSEVKEIIRGMKYGEDGYFWINDTGRPFPYMVMHPYFPDLEGKPMSDKKYDTVGEEKKNLFVAFVDVCENEGGSGYVSYLWPKGNSDTPVPKTSYVMLFKPWNWIIGTGLYTDDIESNLLKKKAVIEENKFGSIVMTVVVLGICILLSLLIANFTVRSITKPVDRMVELSKRIAEGDLTAIGGDGKAGKDEIGMLTRHFGKLRESLAGSISKIKGVTEKNTEANQILSANTEETTTSSTQISANIDSVTGQIKTLDDQIINSSSATEQISKSTQSLKDQIDRQTEMVNESTSSITEMISSVENMSSTTREKKLATDKLVQTARNGGEKLRVMVQSISEINKSVDDISGMVKVISGIAAQTNLLSMNAAIEAAHAGEAGSGFTVVAEEIRKLAESSGKQSGNITRLIKEIVGKIKQASGTSTQTDKAFQEINENVKSVSDALEEINLSAQELLAGGKNILDSIHVLNDISFTVKQGAGEMQDGAVEASKSMAHVRQISSEVNNAMEEMKTGAREITKAMESVRAQTLNINEIIGDLNEAVNNFKL